MSVRELSWDQDRRLIEISRDDPLARVIDWDRGPVVRRGDGRLQRVVKTGRINPVRRPR